VKGNNERRKVIINHFFERIVRKGVQYFSTFLKFLTGWQVEGLIKEGKTDGEALSLNPC
jgi:hypothetical protein